MQPYCGTSRQREYLRVCMPTRFHFGAHYILYISQNTVSASDVLAYYDGRARYPVADLDETMFLNEYTLGLVTINYCFFLNACIEHLLNKIKTECAVNSDSLHIALQLVDSTLVQVAAEECEKV